MIAEAEYDIDCFLGDLQFRVEALPFVMRKFALMRNGGNVAWWENAKVLTKGVTL